ncbi:MAG: transposase [Candidatus Hodarchaeota archaeon]
MIYIPVEKSSDGTAKVIYTSKDGRARETFDALDWLALLVTHIPERHEQTVRYYGYYSNKSRGLREKADADNQLPTIIPGEMSSKEFRQNWARLIKNLLSGPPGMSKMPGSDARITHHGFIISYRLESFRITCCSGLRPEQLTVLSC